MNKTYGRIALPDKMTESLLLASKVFQTYQTDGKSSHFVLRRSEEGIS